MTLFVIQTTEGRKNLVYIHVYTRHCVPEILRFALNDKSVNRYINPKITRNFATFAILRFTI